MFLTKVGILEEGKLRGRSLVKFWTLYLKGAFEIPE